MEKYTVRVSLTVPKGIKARWKERAKAEGISLSEFLRRATAQDGVRHQDISPR